MRIRKHLVKRYLRAQQRQKFIKHCRVQIVGNHPGSGQSGLVVKAKRVNGLRLRLVAIPGNKIYLVPTHLLRAWDIQ